MDQMIFSLPWIPPNEISHDTVYTVDIRDKDMKKLCPVNPQLSKDNLGKDDSTPETNT